MLRPVGRQGRDKFASLKVKLRRRSMKFIPDADGEFAFTAKLFADALAKDPSRFPVPPEDVAAIVEAVEAYRAAVAANAHRYTKNRQTAHRKDEARAVAERLIRDAGNLIRGSRQVDDLTKRRLRLAPRPTRLRRHGKPVTAPELTFAGPVPFTNTVDGKHVIRFRDPMGRVGSSALPAGVERLELAVDLVPVDEPIPAWPGQRWGGRIWYLRSFKRSPMTVTYPKCEQRMRVVYWARWASPSGEQGPWSPTLATRIEGVDRALPRVADFPSLNGPREQTIIITSGHKQLPDLTDPDRVDVTGEVDERRMLTDEREEAA